VIETGTQMPERASLDGAPVKDAPPAQSAGERLGLLLDRLYALRDRTPWREDARLFVLRDR